MSHRFFLPKVVVGDVWLGEGEKLVLFRGLAKRFRAAGMGILLDFHGSDTWADLGHLIKPLRPGPKPNEKRPCIRCARASFSIAG